MSAGFKYDLVPPVEQEERYDVQTGIRRRGPFKLDTQQDLSMTWFRPLSKRNATMSRPAFVDVVRSNLIRRTW